MKKIVLLATKENPNNEPFIFPGQLFKDKSYFDFFDLLINNNVEFFIVRGQDKIISNSEFKCGFKYLGGGRFETVSNKITADLVWDRTPHSFPYPRKEYSKVDILNSLEFKSMSENKWESYIKFPKLFPLTFLIKDIQSIKNNWNNIKTNKIVFKPLTLYGGKGIRLFDSNKIEELIEHLNNNPELVNNSIVEEFCDASIGIKNIVEGIHDLRLMITNGEVIFCYLRQPSKKGEFRANTALGGHERNIRVEDIPTEILDFVSPVIKEISKEYGNPLYSIDLFNTTNGPRVIEFNGSTTGFPDTPEYQNELFLHLAKRFIN